MYFFKNGGVKNTISEMINSITEMYATNKVDPKVLTDTLKEIDNTVKIAKRLNLGEKLEEANKYIDKTPIKGQNISETIRNIKTHVKSNNKIKKVEATKGVKI